MTREEYKSSLIYFLDVVSGDIKALQDLANSVAQQEVNHLMDIKGWDYMTTRPAGALPPQSPEKGVGTKSRCTIPLAMICFSVMDFVGNLILEKKVVANQPIEKKKGKDDKEESTKEKDTFILHTKQFLKELSGKDDFLRGGKDRILQDAYRHSIAHGFLPSSKTSFGYCISYYATYDEYTLFHHLDYLDEYYEKGLLVLNVVCLTKLVKDGISKFREILESDASGQILEKYERIIQDNNTRLSY